LTAVLVGQVEFVFLFTAAHAGELTVLTTVLGTFAVMAFADMPAVPATRIHARIAITFLFISLLLFYMFMFSADSFECI
jgi:hypothetical protein